MLDLKESRAPIGFNTINQDPSNSSQTKGDMSFWATSDHIQRKIVDLDADDRFTLSQSFVESYESREPPWGYGMLSYVTYKRTYALVLDEETGRSEEWWQTCRRVTEGTFTIQKWWCLRNGLPWDEQKAQSTAMDFYERMFSFKFLPPGRGIAKMGTQVVYDRGGACLNNCGFKSTKDIDKDFASPFCWAFDMSMLGVGVGFDTRGVGKMRLAVPRQSSEVYVVQDSREGWVDLLRRLLQSFEGKASLPASVDYSMVRPKGSPIKSFGGTASGPEPLRDMYETLKSYLMDYAERGQPVDSTMIVDIMNIAGKCVVSGGIRRTAQISFGRPEDDEFLDLKLDEEKLYSHRWASNNSLFAYVGMDYSDAAARTAQNGEPGYAWLENMRAYGRMKDPRNDVDHRVLGANPCVEQSLEDDELCCLVETFPAHHDDLDDYKRTLKVAYLYAKTVTLVPTHSKRTNAIMQRNRRIGCSMSGIQQNIGKRGLRGHLDLCDKGYTYLKDLDGIYSDWLCIPRSIKISSVKPSGTVSILAGATPGVHAAHSEFYIRRIRIADTSPLVDICRQCGYDVEPDSYADNTMVISFPIRERNFTRGKSDQTIQEQLEIAALHQSEWADNQVSCTVNFKREEAHLIEMLLPMYEHRLKAISFLPLTESGYEQMPYEAIDEEAWRAMDSSIDHGLMSRLMAGDVIRRDSVDKFCDGESCVISIPD